MKLTGDEADEGLYWDEAGSDLHIVAHGDVPRLPLRVIAPADGEPLRMRRDMAAPRANGSGCVVLLVAMVFAAALAARLIFGG